MAGNDPVTVRVELPPKLIPVFAGEADMRGAHGGRGSGKTRSFAKMACVYGLMHAQSGREGVILCARQFMNSLADSSLEEIKAAIGSESWLAAAYEVGEKYVRTRDGRVSFAFSGLDRSIDSIKSKARILVCWVDEAEPVTDDAWRTLIPTLREDVSELWVTWNPKRKTAPVEKRFRFADDPRIKVVEINWRDNPRFPDILNRQRLRDLAQFPDDYGHIWEGDYLSSASGAYFAKHLQAAKDEGRIGRVAADPLLTFRAFVDIGGTGAKADAFAMWIVQFVGREIRWLDYYEAVGQPLDAHLRWLQERKYSPANLKFWLPHDGATHDKVFAVSYESALADAGFDVTVVPNQGRGAAKMRIEALRRVFPASWFNAETTEAGRDALAWYHEKRDPLRDVGLGPEHDWASHGADAAGLVAVAYETPADRTQQPRRRGSGMAR